MDSLDKSCYAFPLERRYPIYTKQAALESFEQFKSLLDKYSPERCMVIGRAFQKAASVFDIQYDSFEQPAERLTVTVAMPDGGSVTMSKIASVEDIQDACSAILDARHSGVSFHNMQKVAQYVYKAGYDLIDDNKIDALKAEPLLNKVAAYAGYGIGDKELIMSEFCKRGSLIAMPNEVKSKFYKTYRELNDALDEVLYKKASLMCSIMDLIDRMYKLAGYYGNELKSPEDVCFSTKLDDMLTEALDYLTVPSTATVLSKSALLDQKDKVEFFLADKYNFKAKDDKDLLKKVASLSSAGIAALLGELE